MQNEIFNRLERLVGSEGLHKLNNARVIVFGAGGVGGYVIESLVRSGIGHIEVVDKDTVDITNLNRQIIATIDTVGMDKVEVVKNRMLSINSELEYIGKKMFFLPENADEFDFSQYDYVIDAIDNVTAKLELAVRCKEAGTPLISCMGTGNKLDPSKLQITDINKTSVCPLARVMRRELKKRDIGKLDVLFSTEIPVKPDINPRTPASSAFVPGAAGLMIGAYVVRKLLQE